MTMKKAGHSTARRIATASLALCGLGSAALAETRPTYDKRIEEAAIRMLVPKLGEMRGSLELDVKMRIAPAVIAPILESNNTEIPVPAPRRPRESSIIRY